MKQQLLDSKYDFVSTKDKEFIIAFDEAIQRIGYESSGIVPYVCFGKYKIEYSKAGVKNKKFAARFYFRDDCIILRLYFTNIDKHGEYIKSAPDFIKIPFTNDYGKCKHCENGFNKDDKCNFRKTYTIDGLVYEKCSGESFYFYNHEVGSIPEYIELLRTFYSVRKAGK